MLKEALENLRLDRRLVRRRGWIDPAVSDRALEQLPDVAEKGTRGDEEEAGREAPADSAATS